MADLVTHLCIGWLPCILFAPRWSTAVAIGTVLPDLTGRVPQMLLAKVPELLPERILWCLDVAHQPLAQALLVVVIGQGFREESRRRATLGMGIGVCLHFALDILQDHHGNGYYLFFPFSLERFELGWIGSEATTTYALPLLGVTLLALAVRVGWERGNGRGSNKSVR